MKNLILSAACGLEPSQINFFLKSLRKFYNQDVFFLVGKKDFKTKQLLKNFSCNFLEVNTHKFDIQLKRYYFFLKILREKKYKKILFCDSRDIYFQSNPFDFNFKGSINFFLEDKKIKDCRFNAHWMIKTYGQSTFLNLSEKTISCGGTILANHESMEKFLALMISELSKHKYKKRLKYLLTFRADKEGRGCDQSYAAFLIYKNILKNFQIYDYADGPVATVYHSKNYNFNSKNELINSKGEPYIIVHQYDKRWNEFKNSVTNLKKKLGIN